jgi:hypothetical protein
VGETPVADIALSLRLGYRISGQLIFNGTSLRPAPEQLARYAVSAAFARPRQRTETASPRGTVDAEDRFVIRGLVPDRYILSLPDSLPGWSVESVSIGGRDVTDAAFEVTDADIGNVAVTLTDRPADITGTVRDSGGAGDGKVAVFLFPADRARWRDAARSTRLVRTMRVNDDGTFAVPRVLPGEYFIVAVDDELAGAWPDQAFLAKLSGVASSVRVFPNQRQSVSLSTKEVR